MVRVKGGVTSLKRRRSLLKKAKGYRFGRSTKTKQAREAILHAGNHAFDHRKDKKGDFRRLWTVRISASLRAQNLSYSKFIDLLNKKEIKLNRKTLSFLASKHPKTFERVIESVK